MTAKEYLIDNLYRLINKDWEYEQIAITEEFAKLMCDEQKKICLDNYHRGIELATNDIYIADYISNSPYPEELL